MKKIQKNKGITLSSLVIYITVMFVVLAIIIKVVTTFRSNMNEVTDVSFESEFEKLNMYMLTETQKSGNAVLSYNQDGDNISFRDLSSLEFRDEDEDGIGEIYYKDNNGKEIKLCNNVNDFEIEVINENTNTVTIKISITINNIQREKTYVITNVIQEVILPDEYQQVEYIESNGTQYIDTGYILNGNCDVYIDFIPKTTISSYKYGMICGYLHGSSYNDNFSCGIPIETATNSRYDEQYYTWETDYCSFNNRYSITFGKSGYIVNNVTKASYTLSSFDCGGTCYIFAANGSAAYLGAKLYSFKIIDNDEIVMDLIPCYRKSDVTVGLYDLINGDFYTKNSGASAALLKGQNVITKEAPKQEYRELEYIESTGEQLINTEYIPKKNTKIELSLQFSGTFQTSGTSFLGAGYNDTYVFSVNFGGQATQNNTLFPWVDTKYANGATAYPTTITDAIRTNRNTLTLKSGSLTYGTVTKSIATKSADNTSNLYLFGNYNAPFKAYNMRLYSCKIYEGNALVRNFVPAYRVSDGKKGVFDLIEEKFFGNIGSEEFVSGTEGDLIRLTDTNNDYIVSSKLPKEYQEVEYITTVDNGPYIDTGVVPDNNFGFKMEVKTLDTTTDRATVGVIETGNTDTKCWLGYYNDKMYYGWNPTAPAAANRPTVAAGVYNVVEVNYKNSRKYIVDGTTYGTSFPSLVTLTKTFCLMGRNWAGSCAGREQTMKYAIFTSGGQVTHHFIPCYRKADGEIGLYDIISEVFYPKQGPRNFIKGPDVY